MTSYTVPALPQFAFRIFQQNAHQEVLEYWLIIILIYICICKLGEVILV